MRAASIIILFLLCASLATAVYEPTDTIESDHYSITVRERQGDDRVFLITPGEHRILTMSLTGTGPYHPRIGLYDPKKESFIDRQSAMPGESLTYTYVIGEQDEPKSYYVVVNDVGTERMSFTFTYESMSQNDSGTGTDAPRRFNQGEKIMPGTHRGVLGDEDLADSYTVAAVFGETLNISLSPLTEKGRLNIVLIDSQYTRKIDKGRLLEPDERLEFTYTSTADQDLFITIEGSMAYEMVIATDREAEEEEPEPLPPPPLVVVEEVVDEPAHDLVPEERDKQPLLLFIIVIAVLLGGLVFLHQRLKAGPKKGAEQKARKK